MREWVQSISQSDLDEGGSLALSNRTGFQQIEKYEILEVLQKMSPTNLNNLVLKDLPTYSTEGFNDTTKLKLFEDTKEEKNTFVLIMVLLVLQKMRLSLFHIHK